MIKFKFLFFMLVLLLASSCSKEYSENIIGTWVLDSIVIPDCPDAGIPALNNNGSDGCVALFGEQLCLTVVMREDNTGTITSIEEDETYVVDITYTIDDDLGEATVCNQGICRNITFVDDEIILEEEEDGCPVFQHFIKSN